MDEEDNWDGYEDDDDSFEGDDDDSFEGDYMCPNCCKMIDYEVSEGKHCHRCNEEAEWDEMMDEYYVRVLPEIIDPQVEKKRRIGVEMKWTAYNKQWTKKILDNFQED